MASGFIRHFVACNRFDLSRFVPFFIGDKRYGVVKKENAAFLTEKTNLFEKHEAGIVLAARFTDFASRSDALMQATHLLSERLGKPLRDELYPVIEAWGDAPLAQLDRVAVPWFGLHAWGLHVNGFVRKKDGFYLWVGKRAANRQVEPGKLDNMIGGGTPIGLSPEENLCKEAKEEAGMAPELARTAKHVGAISYNLEMPDGLRADTLLVYDIELPEDFVPHNTDGEVEYFSLLPLAEVTAMVRDTDAFKFNCNMIVIDFLMRHGFIAPDNPEYAGLKVWLKQ